MRGHEQIAQARRRGIHPALVWVHCDGYSEVLKWLDELGFPQANHIELKKSDNPMRLDLRCLIGVIVEVSGSDEQRVADMARACVRHRAKQVIAVHFSLYRRGQDVADETLRLTFTNEELQAWPV